MDEWPSTPGQTTVPATAVRVAAAISRAHGHFAALIDADLRVIWGSETIGEMLGVSDPVGLEVLDVIHPEDLEVVTTGLSHHVTHRDDYAHYRPEWRPEPFLLRIGGGDVPWKMCQVTLFNHLEDPDVRAFLIVGHAELDRRDLASAIDLLGSGAGPDEVLPVICRYIDHTLQGSHCEVLWWEEGKDHRLAAHDPESFPPAPPDLVRRARRLGEAQQMDDLAGVPGVPEGIRALRVVPVKAPGRPDVVACLVIWAPMPVGIEAGPQRPVHQAVRLASLAVVNHHSKVALQWEASHDALTGLKNRAGFENDLARQQDGCALLYIDLDDFKPVNDEHGHHAGDAVLVTVGRRLEAAIRGQDSVARIGGDEFAVLIPAPASIDLATDIAARIIDTVSLPISVAGHTVVVGASVGLAMDHGTMDRSSLFERADQALYDAKVGGKHQLAMAP